MFRLFIAVHRRLRSAFERIYTDPTSSRGAAEVLLAVEMTTTSIILKKYIIKNCFFLRFYHFFINQASINISNPLHPFMFV